MFGVTPFSANPLLASGGIWSRGRMDMAVMRRHKSGHPTTKWNVPLPTLVERLTSIFTWWNGQTLNTAFHTKRHGERVGTDQFGNVYYRTIGGAVDPALGFQRRWVIYNGYSEASTVPPGWYGWLHHTTDIAPPDETYVAKEWQKPHRPNMTGTPEAWRPTGSTLRANARQPTGGDYEAWSPEG